jgi:hypothetical protein
MARTYLITINGKQIEVTANRRGLALKRAMEAHDHKKNVKGIGWQRGCVKANGQKDKVGWPLTINLVRTS